MGGFQLSAQFLWKLGMNPWFLMAMGSALAASLVSYFVIASIGIAKGRLFLTTANVAYLVTSYFVFGEKFSPDNLLGVAFVLVGASLLT